MNEVGMNDVRRRRDFRRAGFFGLLIFVAVFLFTILAQQHKVLDTEVEAASLANFDPGYIISDYQMGNYNSMSEAEIQNFLTSKNPCNNTNYNYYLQLKAAYPNVSWHFENGHFVCLSEEKFGDGTTIGSGDTAAHIIWQAAQDYKINPQVLLVLLQKEQGLITDTFPNSIQYRAATGYGCPDTAACSSQYYGFKNQVRKAAAMFRTVLDGGWTNYPLGENYVQYNPDAGCGGSVVNIRNLATSALYRYTPYQPNAAALALGYGSGAYCGAYGNRNFYLYFEDWFGGITSTSVKWEAMAEPRVMTVNRATLIIDAKQNGTTSTWVTSGENYYFDKKTTVFWNGERQTCLQRESDAGTNQCILMARLDDFSLNDVEKLEYARNYEILQWTCTVKLSNQEAVCDRGAYAQGSELTVTKIVMIDGKEYLTNDKMNGYAILAERAKRKFDFETVGPVIMQLKEQSYKYIAGTDETVQTLTTTYNQFIKVAEKVTIDGEVYYRTAVDVAGEREYVIPGAVLEEEIFAKFAWPRNMTARVGTASMDLARGKECIAYKAGETRKYVNKITYNGTTYYQNENEIGTQCAIRAADLSEALYNFNNTNVMFTNFLIPRNLRIARGVFKVDTKTGVTCEDYLTAGDTQKYTTKVTLNGTTFFRTESDSKAGSTCAVPSGALGEI